MFESTPTSPLNSPADSLSTLPDTDPRPGTRTVRRRRTCSSLFSSSSKSTLDMPTKADPSIYLTVRSGNHTAGGAFSPTPSAAAALQFFTATAHPARRPPMPSAWTTPVPVRGHTIPSISRTASSFDVGHLSSSPDSSSLLDFDRDCAPKRFPVDSTPPALASLEKRSRLCTKRVFCATCRTPGTNFPACARCGSAWCSRACRLPGGVRHVCTAAPNPPSRTGISTPPVPTRAPTPTSILIPSTPVPH
ncbi:hypothetical protein DFH09DRAFT_1162250 [Mycena vulgaris]|nr:hypothetical protein DFH09DRAFT_1162250 [Mycena vulgaris]